MDKFAEELCALEKNSVADCNGLELKKNRIKQFLRTGNARKAFGKNLTEKDVDGLSKEEDVEKYYVICEGFLAKEMSDCLGKSFIGFYAELIGKRVMGLDDVNGLRCDLEKDPFTNAALRKFTCNLYFSFGEYLAPVTIAAITLKHYLINGESINKEEEEEEKIVVKEKNEC